MTKKKDFSMHVNMLVQLKSYEIELLEIRLTHPFNVVGDRITHACMLQ